MSTTTVFLVTSVAIALPWAYSLRRSPLSWPNTVSFLLLIHSLASLHTLLIRSPPNIFRALRIPLNTPTDAIRALLLQHTDTPDLSIEHGELLKRLASFDVRSLYPRFGHNVLATCTYCHSFQDFALYALPRPIMSYIREVAFVGLITTERRKMAVTLLFICAVVEFYILATAQIIILPSGHNQSDSNIWWHDVLFSVRQAVFLILPPLVHFTPPFRLPFISGPPIPKVDTSELLMQAYQSLSHLGPTIVLTKYAHAATMRVPDLRARAAAWWAEEAKVGEWIRSDGADETGEGTGTSVRSVAKALGVSYDEGTDGVEDGKLRAAANMTARVLLIDALRLGEHSPPQ